jgi:hypothetical protein
MITASERIREMQDIRPDLRERLNVTVKQRLEMSEQLRALEARERRLQALLRDEESFHTTTQLLSLPDASGGSDGPRLREFVLGSLADGNEWSLEDLKEHANGIGVTTLGATGRALNITLVNLHRQGLVTRSRDGKWRLQNRGQQLALELPSPAPSPSPTPGPDRRYA